jgi:16S rRNA (cytosine1402-N4)-methyltransferase
VEEPRHLSVMAEEALGFLKPRAGGIYVDATLGGGGHALKILTSVPGARLIAIDQDAEAITRCKPILEPFKEQVSFVEDNFRNISEIVQREGLDGVDGILADIGLSTFQLESVARGFSFMKDARLDMRMDTTLETTAYDLVNNLSASELERIFSKYGEERFSRRIARAIVAKRAEREIETTIELRELIHGSVPAKFKRGKIDPATRVFQALRIAVNDELASLEEFLDGSVESLNPGGALVVISFHSLEDRIVKRKFRELSRDCICPPRIPQCVCSHERKLELLTRKPVKPTEIEVASNPRARSAKLRAAVRC